MKSKNQYITSLIDTLINKYPSHVWVYADHLTAVCDTCLTEIIFGKNGYYFFLDDGTIVHDSEFPIQSCTSIIMRKALL